MIPLAILAALLPGIFWDQGIETAAKLKAAGVKNILVPAARVEAWKAAGFQATAFSAEGAKCQEAESPRVDMRMNVASATTAPWVIANGWKYQRSAVGRWCYAAADGGAALAAAEAYAYGVDAVVTPKPADVEELGKMMAFLASIDKPAMRGLANIGVVDDGSESTAEVLNLMSRRNLQFRVLKKADPGFDLTVTPKDVADPYEYAVEVRRKLGDDKRWVKLYGSEVVIARMTGDGGRARLHLLNYSRRNVDGLRVRVLGKWKVSLAVFGAGKVEPAEPAQDDTGTEFSIPRLGTYAVVDLTK